MKNLLIASALAAASVLSVAAQSQAASVTVTTSERMAPRHNVDNRHHRPRHDCMVKKVKTYRHGHVVVKETRVCR
jgi:Ni/Co efflux regulator RcnB